MVVVVVVGGVVVVVVVGAVDVRFGAGVVGGLEARGRRRRLGGRRDLAQALLQQRLRRGGPALPRQRVEDGGDVVEQRVEEARRRVAALVQRRDDGGREPARVVGHDAPADAGQPVAQQARDVRAADADRRLQVEVEPVVVGVVGALGPLEEVVAVLEDLVDGREVAVERAADRGDGARVGLERLDVGHEQVHEARARPRQLGDGVAELARVLGHGARHGVVLLHELLDLPGVRVERAGELGQGPVELPEVVALVGQQLDGPRRGRDRAC